MGFAVDPNGVASALLDTAKAGFNAALGMADLGNPMTPAYRILAMLGGPDFTADQARLAYDNGTFGTGVEILLGFAGGAGEERALELGGSKLVGKLAGCGCCFAKGTPVLTARGLRPIEEVEVGDEVWSRDERTGQTALKRVTELIHHDGREMYALVIVSSKGTISRIEVSDNHPFWVRGQGWVDSRNLRRGMVLQDFDKKPATVANLQDLNHTASTYNFTVEGFHTFFAGDGAVWVHNAGKSCCAVVAGEAGEFADLAARAVKGDKLTPHHMPQAAANFTSRADGGSLMMTEAEHFLTRTYGFRGAITAAQEAGMEFRTVLSRDIRDVRNIVGTKYNEGLRDLLTYYRENFPELMVKK